MLTLRFGTRVRVKGLVAKPDHNGKRARVVSFDGSRCRYCVVLDDGGEMLSLKAACVVAADEAAEQYTLGERYYHGDEGVAANFTMAVSWYRKAAEQGHAEAQYSLGHCYYTGRGVGHDKKRAVKWYQKAAEQGHEDAQFALGRHFFH